MIIGERNPSNQRPVSIDIAVWDVEITVWYDDLMCIIMIQYDIYCFRQIHDACCIYMSFPPMQAFDLVLKGPLSELGVQVYPSPMSCIS